MPYGESVYKFVAIDNETGAASEIVERTYSLHYTVNVSQESAASLLITSLVQKGYLLDGSGTPVATVSVLVNGATASTSRVRKALETLLSTIAEEIPE